MKAPFIRTAILIAAYLFAPSIGHAQSVAPATTAAGGGGGSSVIPWIFMGCVGGIMTSAVAASHFNHRELTAPEAWSCGLAYWLSGGPNQPTTTKIVADRNWKTCWAVFIPYPCYDSVWTTAAVGDARKTRKHLAGIKYSDRKIKMAK